MESQITMLIGVAAAFFFGGMAKGVSGFGMALVSVPLLTSLIDARLALALMTMPILIGNVWQAFYGRIAVQVFLRFWWLMLAMAVGCGIGALLLVRLDPRYIFLSMGVLIIVFVILNLSAPSLALPATGTRALGVLAGLVGGVMGGISTFFGPPIIMYLVALRLPRELFVATLGVMWLFASVLLISSYLSVDILTGRLILWSLACVAPVLAGMAFGQWLRRRVNAEAFRRGVLLFLLVAGLNLIRRAIV